MTAGESTERSVRSVIARLHAAMNAVASGEAGTIKGLYSHRADVTGFYGWGGYEVGWEEVSKRWDWAVEQFKGGAVTYRNLTTIVTADLAYTTDIETFRVRLAGMDAPTEWSNRVTHVFRLEDGEWRLAHRHANRLEAQYAPGARLQRSS